MTDTTAIIPSELKPTLCRPAGNQLGEGATYDSADHLLYWVDILRSQIHFYGDDGQHDMKVPVQPGFVAILESGGFVAGGDQQLLHHADGNFQAESFPDCDPGAVVNDGVATPDGRCLVFGTRDEKEEDPIGRMMVITKTETIVYPDRFTVLNGPAFSPCGKIIYFTDSPTGEIWRADFDSFSGIMGERTLFARVPSKDGYPDGMCTDDEGCLWSAHWDGARLTRYRPNGSVDAVVPVPVNRPTSVVFGGRSRNSLYITSAMPDDQQLRPEGDDITDGDLLSMVMPVTGPPSTRLSFNPLNTLSSGSIRHVS